jgi:hypothetical protein
MEILATKTASSYVGLAPDLVQIDSPDDGGRLYVTNASAYEIQVQIANNVCLVPAMCSRIVPTYGSQFFTWDILEYLGMTNAPSDTVYFEYMHAGEEIYEPVPLSRHQNVGNAIQVITIASGTAFPTNPATGDTYLRTDRNLLYFYDGTQWLTINEYSVTWSWWQTALGLEPFSISPAYTYSGVIGQEYSAYISTAIYMAAVVAPNDPANYWTIQLRSLSDAGSVVILDTWSTSASAAATTITREQHVNTATTNRQIIIRIEKTGAPGAIHLYSTIHYRRIG